MNNLPVPAQRQILDILNAEMDAAREVCLNALLPSCSTQLFNDTEVNNLNDTLDVWNDEAMCFVESVAAYLKTKMPSKRGSNFCQVSIWRNSSQFAVNIQNTKQILEDSFKRSPFLNKAECRLVAKAAGISTQQVSIGWNSRA